VFFEVRNSLETETRAESVSLKFGVQLRSGPISRVVDQAVLCEKVGFDSVWWMDHVVGGGQSACWPELYTTLAVIGASTKKILIGSAVTDTLRRHPSAISQTCATISQLTSGRFVLGLGAGEAMNLIPFGLDTNRAYSRLEEGVEVLRTLMASGYDKRANFQGRFYSLKNAFIQIQPNYSVPIYFGAFSPKMLKLVAKVGVGWLPWSHTPQSYRVTLSQIEDSIKKGCRERARASKFDPCTINVANLSNDEGESREIALESARQMLSTLPLQVKKIAPNLKDVDLSLGALEWMGPLEDVTKVNTRLKLANSIPEEIALQTAIYGTSDDCISKIEEFSNAGCEHIVLSLRGKDPLQLTKDFASKVLSYFRR